VTRPHHALEGKVLKVFAKLRHKGKPHFLLVLPDASRSYIPVAWTDFNPAPESSAAPCAVIASASDLLALRQRVDWLLRRIEGDPTMQPNLPTQEIQHATTAIGVVECRTSPDSTNLSTAHASATEQPRQPPDSAYSQGGPGSSHELSSSTLKFDSKP
jgi:hypothetical protein